MQSQQRTCSTYAGTYKEHGQSPSRVQAALETEETGRGKQVIARSRIMNASAGRGLAVGCSTPCALTGPCTHRELPQTRAQHAARTHRRAQGHTPKASIGARQRAPASGALGWAHGLGMDAWT